MVKELDVEIPFTGSILGAVPQSPAIVRDGLTFPSKAGTHRALGESSLCYLVLWGRKHNARRWHCFSGLSQPPLRDLKPSITVTISALDMYLPTRTLLCYMLHNPWWTPGACDPPLQLGSGSVAGSPTSPEAAGPWQRPHRERSLRPSKPQREARSSCRENKAYQCCFNLWTDTRQETRASSLSAW